jgi:hypothetical protein
VRSAIPARCAIASAVVPSGPRSANSSAAARAMSSWVAALRRSVNEGCVACMLLLTSPP